MPPSVPRTNMSLRMLRAKHTRRVKRERVWVAGGMG